MKKKTKIATQNEVLEFFTDVMRRAEDDVKMSDAMSAADKLHKYFQQKKEEDSENVKTTGIVILPDIKESEEKK